MHNTEGVIHEKTRNDVKTISKTDSWNIETSRTPGPTTGNNYFSDDRYYDEEGNPVCLNEIRRNKAAGMIYPKRYDYTQSSPFGTYYSVFSTQFIIIKHFEYTHENSNNFLSEFLEVFKNEIKEE